MGDFHAHYHAALDVVTVHEVRDRTLVLYDVVGAPIPALEPLVAAIGAEKTDRIVTLFVRISWATASRRSDGTRRALPPTAMTGSPR